MSELRSPVASGRVLRWPELCLACTGVVGVTSSFVAFPSAGASQAPKPSPPLPRDKASRPAPQPAIGIWGIPEPPDPGKIGTQIRGFFFCNGQNRDCRVNADCQRRARLLRLLSPLRRPWMGKEAHRPMRGAGPGRTAGSSLSGRAHNQAARPRHWQWAT